MPVYKGNNLISGNLDGTDHSTLTNRNITDQHTIGAITNLQSSLDAKVAANSIITGATHTKITYDEKGLVTAGTDISLNDATDVSITSPSNNQGLIYNSTSQEWENGNISAEVSGTTLQFTGAYTSGAIDGQWVASWYTLASSSSATAQVTYSLSSYLPDDDYNYEVLIYGQINVSTGAGGYRNLEIGSSIIPRLSICAIRQVTTYTATISSTVLLPVGTNRNVIKVARTSDVGTYSLMAVAYRRIGTNS